MSSNLIQFHLSSKTVAELKMRFPNLQANLRNILSNEMERVCREETFLKEEPDRLEVALRRCKKLTGTLVTLKRYENIKLTLNCKRVSMLNETWHSSFKHESPRKYFDSTGKLYSLLKFFIY